MLKIRKLLSNTIFVSSIVSLLVTLVTNYFAFQSSLFFWQQDRSFNVSRVILEKRLDLINRLAILVGQKPIIQGLWRQHIKNNPTNADDGAKLSESNGEFQSVLFQTSFFFGPLTLAESKLILNETSSTWLEKPQDAYLKLLRTMKDELLINLGDPDVTGFQMYSTN